LIFRKDNVRAAADHGHVPFRGALKRRQFIFAGAGVLFLAACGELPAARPTLTSSPRFTIDSLLATTPFYVAHRGSGDNWVEHSMSAYEHSVSMGAKAIEVSVNATSDGVLVCHHDVTTKRLTGKDVKLADITYAELSHLLNSSTEWLGPAAKPQPIPRLTDVLDRFATTHVIFIEDKQGTNTHSLLATISKYPKSSEHFVWKTWAGAVQYKPAQSAGYRIWGYFSEELYPRADELSSKFDYLGVYSIATDAQVQQIVSYGPKLSISMNAPTVYERDPSLSANGLHLFFAAGLEAAVSTAGIYVSSRASLTDDFVRAVLVDELVGIDASSGFPFVTRTNDEIYYNGTLPGSGSVTLMRATRAVWP